MSTWTSPDCLPATTTSCRTRPPTSGAGVGRGASQRLVRPATSGRSRLRELVHFAQKRSVGTHAAGCSLVVHSGRAGSLSRHVRFDADGSAARRSRGPTCKPAFARGRLTLPRNRQCVRCATEPHGPRHAPTSKPPSGRWWPAPRSQRIRRLGISMTRSTTAPWKLLGRPAPGGVEPVMRRIGTVAGVTSPLRSKLKLPSRPSLTLLA
jgi:hypothetical protein